MVIKQVLSTTNGYQTGGQPPTESVGNVAIFKFNMTTGTPVVVYGGTLTVGRYSICNHSDTENGQGFTSGGREETGPPNPTPYSTVCEKFSFTSEAPATDVGNLSSGRIRGTGITDNTNGRAYSIGGQGGSAGVRFRTDMSEGEIMVLRTMQTDI
jgi:hypothetical protein